MLIEASLRWHAEVALSEFLAFKMGNEEYGINLVSDVITFTPEQLRPVPDISSAVGSGYLLAIGSLQTEC